MHPRSRSRSVASAHLVGVALRGLGAESQLRRVRTAPTSRSSAPPAPPRQPRQHALGVAQRRGALPVSGAAARTADAPRHARARPRGAGRTGSCRRRFDRPTHKKRPAAAVAAVPVAPVGGARGGARARRRRRRRRDRPRPVRSRSVCVVRIGCASWTPSLCPPRENTSRFALVDEARALTQEAAAGGARRVCPRMPVARREDESCATSRRGRRRGAARAAAAAARRADGAACRGCAAACGFWMPRARAERGQRRFLGRGRRARAAVGERPLRRRRAPVSPSASGAGVESSTRCAASHAARSGPVREEPAASPTSWPKFVATTQPGRRDRVGGARVRARRRSTAVEEAQRASRCGGWPPAWSRLSSCDAVGDPGPIGGARGARTRSSRPRKLPRRPRRRPDVVQPVDGAQPRAPTRRQELAHVAATPFARTRRAGDGLCASAPRLVRGTRRVASDPKRMARHRARRSARAREAPSSRSAGRPQIFGRHAEVRSSRTRGRGRAFARASTGEEEICSDA